MSFVPNLEACHCLLLIFDASFDIPFTFLPDMPRKHLYQSVSCMARVVRMSGLPYSLHSWRECVLCPPALPAAYRKCAVQTACEQEINMHSKSHFAAQKVLSNLKPIVNCEL